MQLIHGNEMQMRREWSRGGGGIYIYIYIYIYMSKSYNLYAFQHSASSKSHLSKFYIELFFKRDAIFPNSGLLLTLFHVD